MDTPTWFKIFFFLLVVGTVISLLGGGSLSAPVPPLGTNYNVLDLLFYASSIATFYVGFFSGFATLISGDLLPIPLNYILLVCIAFGWMFLFFEFVASVRSMFTSK